MNNAKTLLWILVPMFILMDVVFIYDLTMNHMTTDNQIRVMPYNNEPYASPLTGQTRQTADLPKKNDTPQKHSESSQKVVHVKLLSSKEKAVFTVDGETVLHADKDKYRGINVMVINQVTGAVLTTRCFDTYYPGGSEKLEIFLESMMSGRYLFFAIKDEATYSLKDGARQMLRQMGSHIAESLHWRDMWVFAVQKHGQVLGEDYSKSPSLAQWGELTALSVTVPLGTYNKPLCKCNR